MPQVELSVSGNEETSLYTCIFNRYVQVIHPPERRHDLRGKVCLWTGDNLLMPLDNPGNYCKVGEFDETTQSRVRYLTEGEVLTIKF